MSLKLTVDVKIYSDFDDGAGNTGQYRYDCIAKELTIRDADIWKLNLIEIVRPGSDISWAASQGLTTLTGTPPAIGTRTLAINSSGECTFKDADESINRLRASFTFSEEPDHDYGMDFLVDYVASGKFAKLAIEEASVEVETSTNPTEVLVDEDNANPFGVARAVTWYFAADDVTANRIPQDLWGGFVEEDLMSREYSGRMIEVGVKAILAIRKANRKAGRKSDWRLVSAIVPEIATYLKGDGPLDLYIPRKTYKVAVNN